jgi:hypothetical protein
LIALAVLCVVGLATAAVASSGTFRGSFGSRAKDAVAARLKHAQ